MPRLPAYERDFSDKPLGFRPDPSREHIRRYPLRAVDLREAERPKSKYWTVGVRYDQGSEGACVGMACAAFASHYNFRRSRFDAAPGELKAKFDAFWLYEEAKKIDPWPGEDYDGTSTNAGLEVVRTRGVAQLDKSSNVVKIQEYRWAQSLDDILNWLSFKGPVIFGMDWYSNFDRPQRHAFPGKTVDHYFIGEGSLGYVRGGHCIIAHAYRRLEDGSEWIRLQNSWGYSYPLSWIPARVVGDLLDDGALEAGMVTQIPW